MNITTSIIIDAPVEEVKRVFFDFPGYKTWNPFFKSIEVLDNETPIVGSQLKVVMQPEGGSQSTFKPYVLENSETLFKWKGTLLFEFIATGVHSFEFIPLGTGTKLVQSEEFGGFVFSWFKNILVDTEKGFNSMNKSLKEKVESK